MFFGIHIHIHSAFEGSPAVTVGQQRLLLQRRTRRNESVQVFFGRTLGNASGCSPRRRRRRRQVATRMRRGQRIAAGVSLFETPTNTGVWGGGCRCGTRIFDKIEHERRQGSVKLKDPFLHFREILSLQDESVHDLFTIGGFVVVVVVVVHS